MGNQWIPLKKCKSGEVLISAEFIPQAELQKRIQLEPSKSVDKQEDTKKYAETTKQDTLVESSQEEVLIQEDVQIESTTAKGGKGLKEVLNREKKVSSETIIKPDQSIEPEVIIPKPREVEPGLISVTVHKARDIEKKGMFGKADPYVIMGHGDQKAKSKTIKNNYNPEWEFNAKFNIKKDAAEGIKISVFDDDIGKDDALGMKVLDIGSVQEYQQLKNQWIPLENCKSGEVLISAEFTPQALVEEAEKSVVVQSPEAETKDVAKAESEDKKKKDVVKVEVEEASKTDAGKVKDLDVSKKPDAAAKPKHIFEAGRLIITVFKARDIEKKGMFGKADPYVHITLGKQKAKSKTVKNNHNPEWNFDATFEVDQNTPEAMRVDVFDEDLGKDDILGHKVLDISTVLEKIVVQDTTVVKQVVEEPEAAKSIKPEREEETKEGKQKSSKATKIKESQESGTAPVSTPKNILEPGQVVLTVYKARDIEKKGKFGKADPYVKMTLGEQKAKSATVKNNHNPEWNFKATFDIHENTANEVIIAVYDEDFGKDDTLGSTVLDLNEVQDKKQLLNQWIPLKKCKSGEVLISAEFIPQAELQKRIQLEPSKSVDKQEDTKKISETTKQDTLVESSQEEVLIQKDVQIESTTAKGGKGLKEVLNREKKVSSETIVKPDQSIEPEVIIPKPREVEPGLISVTVHKARDIEKKGMFGKADPYVIMTHGDQKAKSKTIKNNYNPEWEFNAKFNIKKEAAEGIKISVFDDDIGKDDALG